MMAATTHRTIRVADDVWEPVAKQAADEGRTMTEVIVAALKQAHTAPMAASDTDSLQSGAPLDQMSGSQTARSMDWLAGLATGSRTEADMDQPYQRGIVWGKRRQRLLIKSLMLGVPIGAIVVNDRAAGGFQHYSTDRHQPSRDWAYAVIDGKQRITAMAAWMRGELAVPASWFPSEEILTYAPDSSDGPYVRLSDLAKRQARFFGNKPIGVLEARLPSLAAEEQVFRLINFGGVPQGETDQEAQR